MCSDYDNPYGMSEQEFEYRAMNPQDPMYMGNSYTPPYNVDPASSSNQKTSKKDKQKGPQPYNPEEEHVIKDMPEWLFVLLAVTIVGVLCFVGIWLLTLM